MQLNNKKILTSSYFNVLKGLTPFSNFVFMSDIIYLNLLNQGTCITCISLCSSYPQITFWYNGILASEVTLVTSKHRPLIARWENQRPREVK